MFGFCLFETVSYGFAYGSGCDVHRAINLERNGCNDLVTTRDKKLRNHIAHAIEDT